jgi:magnesium chelatase subunit H
VQLLREAENIRGLLLRNREELAGMLRALDGAWVPPEAGGDLLRDGPGVLPTGGCKARRCAVVSSAGCC